MGWASRKTLANFWRVVRAGLEAAAAEEEAVVDVAAADAIVEGFAVVGLGVSGLQDWLVQVVHFALS